MPTILVLLTALTPCLAWARQLAYVANSGSDTVSVIDTEKQAVVQTIAVGNGLRPVAVAVSPDGRTVYVSSYSGTVAIVDTATNAVRASIPVGVPGQLLPSPDGNLLYVANGTSEYGYVAVIDLKKQLFTNAIPVAADAFALSPDGRTLYALHRFGAQGGSLSIVDAATAATLASVELGAPTQDDASPTALALSLDGTRALVGISCSCWPTPGTTCTSRVLIVDTAAAKVTATVDLGTGQTDSPTADTVAFAPAGAVAHVGGQYCNALTGVSRPVLSVLDITTGQITATTNLQGAPQALAISPDGASVYVAETGSALEAVDTATGTVRARITAPTVTFDVPVSLALSPDGGSAYLAAYKALYIINTADLEVTATISGAAPSGLALSPDKRTLYVANALSGTVSVLNTATGAVAHTVAVGPTASVVASAADGSAVFVLSGCPDEGNCCPSQQDCNPASNISVLDPVTNVVKRDMRVPVFANDIAASPDGRLLYSVGCTDMQWCASGALTVFDLASGTAAGSVRIPGQPGTMALSPDARTAYVGAWYPGSVSLVDTATMSIRETFATASQVQSLMLNRDATALYFTESSYGGNGYGGLVSAMKVPAGTSMLNLPVDGARAIALTADGASAYITVYSGSVSVVDIAARREGVRIPVGQFPGAIVMGPAPGAGTSTSGGGGCAIHAHADRYRAGVLLWLVPLFARMRRMRPSISSPHPAPFDKLRAGSLPEGALHRNSWRAPFETPPEEGGSSGRAVRCLFQQLLTRSR